MDRRLDARIQEAKVAIEEAKKAVQSPHAGRRRRPFNGGRLSSQVLRAVIDDVHEPSPDQVRLVELDKMKPWDRLREQIKDRAKDRNPIQAPLPELAVEIARLFTDRGAKHNEGPNTLDLQSSTRNVSNYTFGIEYADNETGQFLLVYATDPLSSSTSVLEISETEFAELHDKDVVLLLIMPGAIAEAQATEDEVVGEPVYQGI